MLLGVLTRRLAGFINFKFISTTRVLLNDIFAMILQADEIFDVNFRVQVVDEIVADVSLSHEHFGKNENESFDRRVVVLVEALVFFESVREKKSLNPSSFFM